jgi:hypothetical protein
LGNPPVVSGNTLTWNVSDFGVLDTNTNFSFLLHVLYAAQITDQVCFTASVSLLQGDYNASNNVIGGCYPIQASWDPNEKQVFPTDKVDTTQPWLTYTIHFQNTGTGAAINIHVDDTIDVAHLDISTFQLLAYSSQPQVQIHDKGVVRFTFPNINLPDSTTTFTGSQGYVQYKIKLIDGLPLNTQITNTASVYFDLNPPVVTNTTHNTVTLPTGIAQVKADINMQLYPNPTKNYVIVETDENALGGTLQITDVTGQQIARLQITNIKYPIATSGLSAGVYFVKVNDNNGRSAVRKLVVE